jgi:hypothetical protein
MHRRRLNDETSLATNTLNPIASQAFFSYFASSAADRPTAATSATGPAAIAAVRHLTPSARRRATPSSSQSQIRAPASRTTSSLGGAATAAARAQATLAAVQEAVRGVVGSAVAPDAPLMESGLDSLGAVELRNALEGRLQVGRHE